MMTEKNGGLIMEMAGKENLLVEKEAQGIVIWILTTDANFPMVAVEVGARMEDITIPTTAAGRIYIEIIIAGRCIEVAIIEAVEATILEAVEAT